MIACASPADSNADESINTLRYAQRARSIQNLATQHSSQLGAGEASGEVLALRKELRLLQLQLAHARGGSGGSAAVGAGGMRGLEIGGGGAGGGEASLSLVQVLREENGRLRATMQQLEAEARAAAEAGALNVLLLESLRLRLEHVGALAKEAGLELPAGLLDDDGTVAAAAALMSPASAAAASASGGTTTTTSSSSSSSAATPAADITREDSSSSSSSNGALAASLKGEAGAGSGMSSPETDEAEADDAEGEADDAEGEADGDGEGEGLAAAQTLVSGELASLDEEIKRKEEAVAQLAREGQCFGTLKSFFEGTIARLQAEVQALQGEREKLATALTRSQAAGKGADPTVVAGMRAREKELEKKLRELQAKSASYNRVVQLKGRAEDETRRLRGEIEAAKKRQGELMRRHREEAKRLCKERRAKELEAVRLRRNETRLKCEYERSLQVSARQEAVLRRKLEEVTAVCKQYQETVRRLTEGSKGRFEGQSEGPRQQQRHRELRRHVQREMGDCRAYLAKRAVLRQLLERRAGLTMTEAEQRQQQEEEELAALSASIQVLHREVLEAEAVVVGAGLGGRDVGSSPAAADEQARAAAEEALMFGEAPSAVVGSTRRWMHIKTLGEARHVLAYLFGEAVTASSSSSTEKQAPALPALPTTAAMLGASPIAQQGQAAAVAAPPAVSSKPNPKKKEAEVEVESEEEEDDWEDESSSDEEEEESDEEYRPEDSPSRAHARARARAQRGSKEGRGGGKQKQQKAKARGSSGSGGSGGLEDEIDALLSGPEEDGEEGDVFGGWPPPAVASLEPLGKCTVAQLKLYLKGYGLPLSGRKGTRRVHVSLSYGGSKGAGESGEATHLT